MTATNDVCNIESIEEFTLFSLDRSPEGIASLCENINICGLELLAGNHVSALERLSALVSDLHSFDTFEHSLCSLFQIDRSEITCGTDSLQDTMEAFRTSIQELQRELDRYASEVAVINILNDLPHHLSRFKTLIPTLKHYIETRYIAPETQ